ncbi:MAG: murein biosynthesis integral membrane protein MurJ [Anaerolineae bacterium]
MTKAKMDARVINADRARVLQAASLVGAAVFVSRILGLVRDMITKNYLGVTTLEATAYDAANRFPEAIFLIIAGGAIGSAFIPTFSAYLAREDEAGGWRLFSAVINLTTLVVTVVAGLAILLAPQFVDFFMADLIIEQPAIRDLTIQLMRIMLLSTVIFGASGVIMGALNARQHFLLPALAPIIYNLGIIAGVVLLTPKVMGLAIGTVFGAVGHLMIQLPGLRQQGARYTAVLTLRDPGVRQVLRLMAPRVLGLSFSEINKFLILFLTGSMMLGSLPALNTALRIIIMPQGILGQAMGIAAFPTMAALAARSAHAEMRHIVTSSLRLLLFLGMPVTVLLMLLREPIIAILYQRGLFGSESTELVAWALLFLAMGLVALAALEVIARAFYALNDTLTPVLAGGIQVTVMGLLSYWLSRDLFPSLGWLPLGGLALGFTLSNFLEAGLLLLLLRRKMGRLEGWALLDGLWRIMLASALMGTAVWGGLAMTPATAVWLQAVLGGVVGGLVYLLACTGLRVSEMGQIWCFGRERLGFLRRMRGG